MPIVDKRECMDVKLWIWLSALPQSKLDPMAVTVCSLIPQYKIKLPEAENHVLNIIIPIGSKVEFEIIGKNSVHLLGNYLSLAQKSPANKAEFPLLKSSPCEVEGPKPDSVPSKSGDHSLSCPFSGDHSITSGIPGMKVNGERTFVIPPNLGYGVTGDPDHGIPPNEPIVYKCMVLGIEPQTESAANIHAQNA
ncbi:predicted protein [Postia placenta Mad-698-R]|nr:predicted protein [Postia placenta Mad-698-R]